LGAVKKNEWSIPRTVSHLSHIPHPRYLDTAADLIQHHQSTGNAFIHLAGEPGLILYESTPLRVREHFIHAFRHNPRTFIGVTKAHLIIHSIKILEKYGVGAAAVPFVTLATILSAVPAYVLWLMLVAVVWYLLFCIREKQPQFKGGSKMLNQVVLTGNLGADPEIFYGSDGEPVAKFNLAFRSSKKKTGWISVTCFQGRAKAAEKFLHKGARVGISGTLQQDKWETEQGASRSSYQVICYTLELIRTDGRGFEEGQKQEDVPF
jgi:single-strand DNA-binding protein